MSASIDTPKFSSVEEQDKYFMNVAFEEAKKGYAEGGIPIGAALVSADGKLLGSGHNKRVQQKSVTLHGEMDALENAGRLPGSAYKGATMYTTLSPCHMCTGACLLYGISRVVLAENKTFLGGEDLLRSKGVEVKNVHDDRCLELMNKFVKEKPELWNEDIGE